MDVMPDLIWHPIPVFGIEVKYGVPELCAAFDGAQDFQPH